MHSLTIFTTTYHRPVCLKRLYLSLLEQTNKDFEWLVVADDTDEQTSNTVMQFCEEKLLDIIFIQQQHQGKTKAMINGFSRIQTPYMIDIDDDDELKPEAVEVFASEWKRIEEMHQDDIGMVCAMSENERGEIVGKISAKTISISYDTDYVTQEWTNNRHAEYIISRKVETIKDLSLFDDDGKWLRDRVTLVLESVYWNRMARKWKTRYLPDVLRVYHTESNARLSVNPFNEEKCYNYVFSIYVMLNELKGRYNENLRQTIKYIAEYMVCGMALGLPMTRLVGTLDSRGLRIFSCVLLPLTWFVGIAFRKCYF